MKKVRVDRLLFEQGIPLPLARAKIMAGQVFVGDTKISSPALQVSPLEVVRVRRQKKYVSRGGKKLELVLRALQLSVVGKRILDIGASTGGFTDCCLQQGAAVVTTVDVGTNQLAWKLRNDPRVQVFEKTDIRDYVGQNHIDVDLILADVSFISLTTVLPPIFAQARQAEFLVLVKPQFELPRCLVPQGGVVRESKYRKQAVVKIKKLFVRSGYKNFSARDAEVWGIKGNREVFCYAQLA